MPSLTDLAHERPVLTLDELASTVNDLLPGFLPGDTGGRVKADVNPRLVRHYTSEGLLDDALRDGREARYEYRHILQLLLVRRLLAEGLTTGAIGTLVREKSSDELRAMLECGVCIEISPQMPAGNEALDYLEEIRRRPRDRHVADPTPEAPRPRPVPESSWDRHEILDGLELHIRSDFTLPRSLKAQENLIAFLTRKLIELGQRRTKR